MNIQSFQHLTITFETLIAPPPYSHAYQFVLKPSGDQLAVAYELTYTGREDLSEEDIAEEGFTPDDDYTWQGTLPAVWQEAVIHMLQQTTSLRAKPKATDDHAIMLAWQEAEAAQQGIPDNAEAWAYFLQEMIQAVFEVSQRESPLVVRYCEITKAGEKLEVVIQPSFSRRALMVKRMENGISQQLSSDWAALKLLLKAIYLPDYDETQARKELPIQPGQYIDPGTGLWYILGQSVTNPGKRYDAVGAIEQQIKAILR